MSFRITLTTHAQDVSLSFIGNAIRCAPFEYTFNIVRCAFWISGVGEVPPVYERVGELLSACIGLDANLRESCESHRLVAEEAYPRGAMKPITTDDEARSIDNSVSEGDLHAVLILLERHQLVSEYDWHALRLGRLDDGVVEDWPPDAHHGVARLRGQARRVVVVHEDGGLILEHGTVFESLEGRTDECVRQAGDQPQHAQAVGLHTGKGSVCRQGR